MIGRWAAALVAVTLGGATFAVAAAAGHGWELLWLPAVLLAAAWPRGGRPAVGGCLQRLRRRR